MTLLRSHAEVVVTETSDALVRWNRTYLAELAGRPIEDPRVRLVMGSVVDRIAESDGGDDAILLDVDNGPVALVHTTNDRLYDEAGTRACLRALRPHGVLAVWSAFPNDDNLQLLCDCGLDPEELIESAG